VRRLCKDFADDNDPKYESAHIYFTSHLPDELLFSIRNVRLPALALSVPSTLKLARRAALWYQKVECV
jgi:hypothetical protein